jgi:hypothetical protein
MLPLVAIVGVLIPPSFDDIMSVALAVIGHETSELPALAKGLRVAKR